MVAARAALLVMSVAVSLPASAGTPFSEGMITLTFDDNLVSQYTLARPALKQYGFHATFYVISGRLAGGPGMTVAQVKGLMADGHEIGSHTVDHLDLTTLSDADLAYQLGESQSQLVSLLGLPDVQSFASPFGAYNQRVLDAIRRFYASHRTCNYPTLDFRDTDRYQLLAGDTPLLLSDIKRWVDTALQQRSWAILYLHNLTDTVRASTDFAYSDFLAALDYIAQKNIKVVTIQEGVALMAGAPTPTPVPAPTLGTVTPNSGPAAGGSSVTLTGTGFATGAAVAFGGAAAAVSSASATTLVAVTPAHSAGAVDVKVTNPDGQSATLAGAFTYAAAPPPPPPPPPPTPAPYTPLAWSGWETDGVTIGSATTFAGRTAQKVTETSGGTYHYVVGSDATRGTGSWELTVVAHADLGSKLYLQIDPGGAPYPQARFDLASGLVHSAAGGGATVGASVDDLGGGWYRCHLLVSSPIQAVDVLVSLLDPTWATSYPGDGSRDVYIAEVTLDPR